MGTKIRYSIVFVAILLCFLALIDKAVTQGVKFSEVGQTGKINQLFLHKVNHEVVMFGASNGEVGFDAKLYSSLTGREAFNMCIDGTDISQYADLVKELCDYSDTKEVMFALSPNGMFPAKLPTEINRYLVWVNNKYISNNALYHNYENFKRIQYVPFYKFTVYNSIFYRTAASGWAKELLKFNNNSCYKTNGWNPMKVNWKIEKNQVIGDSIMLHINHQSLNVLEDLLKLLKSKNKKARIIIMPCEGSALAKFKNYRHYSELLQKLSLKYSVPFFDTNIDKTFADRSYFYNYTHLNTKGAQIFTRMLAQRTKAEDI